MSQPRSSSSFAAITGLPTDNVALAAALNAKANLAGGNSFTGAQAIASGTLAASAPSVAITQTWNNAGVSFVGHAIDITNTASGASSNIAQWRVGGVSQFRVDKDGNLYARASLNIGTGANTSIQEGIVYGLNRFICGANASLNSTNWGANPGLAMSNAATNGVRWSSTSSPDGTSSFSITRGTVTPEGNETAGPGSLYLRNNSGTGEAWLKNTGTGNTGWTKIL